MSIPKPLALIGGALLIVLAAAGFWRLMYANYGEPAPGFRIALGTSSGGAPESEGEVKSSVQEAVKQGPKPAQGPLQALYVASDIRVLVEKLKIERPPGYGLVITEGLAFCRTLRDISSPNNAFGQRQAELKGSGDSKDAGRVRALASIEAKCASFAEAELTIDGINNERALAEAQDPVLRASMALKNAIRNPPTLAEAKSLAAVAVDARYPNLGSDLYSHLVKASGVSGGLAVNGERFGGLPEAQFMAAWKLANCGLAGTCDTQGLSLQYDCAVGVACYASQSDYILKSDDFSADQVDAVRRMAISLRENLEAKNWAFFGL